MPKLYGAELAESIKKSLEQLKKSADDRELRIAEGLTDIDDCFISMKVNAESQYECETQLRILAGDGLMNYDAIVDENGVEVNVHWANTRYGTKIVGRGIFASSRKALLKKTGWTEKTIKVPCWTKFFAGSGSGMCGVYTGSVSTCRWHTNMVTGEYVGYPEDEVSKVG